MSPKRVGFLIYPAMQALDLVGPMDAFSAVTLADGKGRRRHDRTITITQCGRICIGRRKMVRSRKLPLPRHGIIVSGTTTLRLRGDTLL